ncbi:DUF927 domain-containing protein [Kitasatospora sp. NPDC097643]|uniref:DUF927 domain-containing protein n=1 Tax=Kitasatospora sp. NPDC097643 TaxID=3157230 RepID=UPI00332363C6
MLVCCQRGCTTEQVADSLGLALADLYDAPRTAGTPRAGGATAARKRPARPAAGTRQAKPKAVGMECAHEWRKVTEYTYADAEGTVTGWVIRKRCEGCGEKLFAQARPGASGRREYKAPTVRPLYRLPDVVAAISYGIPVHVVEGEKDADNGAAAGMVTTTSPAGAEKWLPEHTEALAGAHVVVVADRDASGYRHAVKVRDALAGVAASVRVVRGLVVEAKADLSDHLAAGHGADALEEIDPAAELAALQPAVAPAEAPADDDAETEPEESAGGTVVPFPRNGGDGGGRKGGGGGRGGGAAKPDEFPIPTTAGGSWSARLTHGRGIYRNDVKICDFPYVLEVVHRRTARGKREEFRLCLDAAGKGPVVRVGRQDLPRGEFGADLGAALPVDKKILDCLATAVIIEGYRKGVIHDTTPAFDGAGLLAVPPADVLPEGYGTVAECTEDDARTGWKEMAQRAAQHPKMALALGIAAFSPYVGPMRRQPFTCHLCGDARQGKTTATYAAAALFGNPRVIVRKWSRSIPGLSYGLAALGVLPPFNDELGGAGFTPVQLEEVVFTIAQRGQRTTATRYTKEAETSPPWDGTAFSTGNNSIIGQVANPGVHARVVEIATPIVGPPNTEEGAKCAEYFTGLDDDEGAGAVDRFYGWPLRWIRGVPVADVRPMVRSAEQLLPLPAGGVARTIGQHLAGGIAGAALLDKLVGTDGQLAAAALRAAREHLTGIGSEGVRDAADVLLDSIRTSMREQPAKWPTRKLYEEMTGASQSWSNTGTGPAIGMDRTGIYGIILEEADRHSVVMLSGKTARKLCEDDGIDETIAVRGLNQRELLVISESMRRQKKLQNRVKVAGKTHAGYCVKLTDDDEPEGTEEPSDGPSDGPDDAPRTDGPAGGQQDGTGPLLCRGCGEPMVADMFGDGLHATCEAPPEPDPTNGWGPGTLGAAMAEQERQTAPAAPPAPPAVPASSVAPVAPAVPPERPERATRKAPGEGVAFSISGRVTEALAAHGGDVEAATAALIKRAIPDAMALLDSCRASARYDHTSFPKMPEPLIRKGRKRADDIWEARPKFVNSEIADGIEVSALDVNGAYLSALKSAHLPIGSLRNDREEGRNPAMFDRRRSGIYLIEPIPWTHPHLPNPMGDGREATGPVWISRSTLDAVFDAASDRYGNLCATPVILESWTAGESTSILRKFADILTDERTRAIATGDTVTLEYVKAMYSKFVSTAGDSNANHELNRSDWVHIIRSQAFANLWRKAIRATRAGLEIYKATGTDELHVVGDWRSAALLDRNGKTVRLFTEGRALSEMKVKNTYTVGGEFE